MLPTKLVLDLGDPEHPKIDHAVVEEQGPLGRVSRVYLAHYAKVRAMRIALGWMPTEGWHGPHPFRQLPVPAGWETPSYASD